MENLIYFKNEDEEISKDKFTSTKTQVGIKYTVTFSHAGYGTGTMEQVVVEHGDYVLPESTYTPKYGYIPGGNK